LVAPILLTIVPTAGISFLSDEAFHQALAGATVLIASIAFRKGFSQHQSYRVIALACFGLGLLLFSAFNFAHLLNEASERNLTVLGGVLVAISHIWNWKLICLSHDCCQH
jgi:hypothetical protein